MPHKLSAFHSAKSMARGIGLDPGEIYRRLSAASLRAAIHEQGLDGLCRRLRRIVPDLSLQYTYDLDPDEYARFWEIKLRGLHAFQVSCVLDVLDHMAARNAVIADIGDSSGNHATYIGALAKAGQVDRVISVNLDPTAVEKVRRGGGEAVLGRAEELDHGKIHADLYLSFETVEHLTDPLRFLHDIAVKGSGAPILISVPYRRQSRFGGSHLRLPDDRLPFQLTAEQVHIFELSPDDWKLLARFAGWRVEFSRIYRQYPRFHPLRLTRPLWKNLDFEGFLALYLTKDLSLSDRYRDW